MYRSRAIIVLVFSVLVAFSQSMSGQSSASVVEGMIQDGSGAVIQKCDVTLLNVETGGKFVTLTNESGVYAFPSVQPGLYSLEASKSGFESYSITNFRVTISQRLTQNIILGPGTTTATVTVDASGAASLSEPTSNELGTLIEPESVRYLPLNGRDFLQLGLLSGAAQTSGTVASDFLTLQVGHPDRTIVIDGNEQDLTAFLINGISTGGSRLGQASLNLSVAAIDQFKIHEGFFLPSEGPNDAGVVSVVTKAGTNRFHGEVFEFIRNNAFDTRQFFDAPGSQPSPFHRNQFGGAVGGPVLKNRLFYFAHYEGRRQVLSNTAKATVPSIKMFSGDFSELNVTIFDPETYDPRTGTRQPFPGNAIPANRINPMASKLLAYYRSAANYAPENLVGNPAITDNYDQFGGRVDFALNAKNNLFGQFVRENSPTEDAGLFPLAGYGYPLNTKFFMAQLTSVVTQNVVNEFRLGWIRPSVFFAGNSQSGVQGKMGFTGTADTNGVPGIFLAGFNLSTNPQSASFGQNQGLIGNIDNQYQMHEGMSLLKSKHQISFGADLAYIRSVQESSNFYSRGGVWFSPIFSAQMAPNSAGQPAPVNGTGSSFADFLLGMPQTGSVTSMPRTHVRWTAFTPYVQDTWRFRPGLTLNLGLGWNISTPPNPSGSDSKYPHGFDFKTGEVKFAALGQIDPEVYKIDLNNFAPRLGISWQPSFLSATVIRVGAGIYYPSENALYELFAITAPGVAIVQSLTNNPSSPMPTYVLGQNVFPPVSQAPLTPTFAQNLSGVLFALDTNLRTPYVEQWNLAIQHSLTRNTIAEIDYIGSQSRKLPIRWNADDCSVPDSLTCDQTVRPYPQFKYLYMAADEANASYNALVLKLQRQFTNGFSFVANYTWSKVLSNTVQGGAPVGINQRGVCRSCDRGLTGYNVPQRFVASGVWNLPLGKGQRFINGSSSLTNQIVGGWSLNAIATLAQGNPFTVIAASSTAMDPMTNFRANQLCNGRSSLANKNVRSNGHYWFDTACFATPAPNTFGNSGPNTITGPGVENWDIGAAKLLTLHESMGLQFRVDAFNAFNHAQFLNPDSNMTDTNFGRITTVGPSREIQFGLKLLW
jgi:Carboxypeptidase regulatory-like domain